MPGTSLRVGLAALTLGACRGPQSALDPAGESASRVASLFWVMLVGAAVVWAAVVALTVWAARSRADEGPRTRSAWLIIGGGAAVPTVVLTALLAVGLSMLPAMVAPAPPGSLRVAVTGEQWWWRVRYPRDDGAVTLANELHLPLGEPVDLTLDSADVIHSFWIPPLGGKLDMLPGRPNRLALRATRAGVFRGVCAEYCGDSHALMAFDVVVEPREALDRWLTHQAEPAATPTDPLAARGAALFVADGCGACHAVRGTVSDGRLGPDLTHVGSRRSLAAGTLRNEPDALTRWIARADALKPDAHMPAFAMLARDDLRALAAYLEALR
ncbi:MAG: cytochrome c oxidase subunit II [Polyangiales bacterium]